ncbi:MAG: Zn-dependent hydrolase [bacterium]
MSTITHKTRHYWKGPKINTERLMQDIYTLSQIGKNDQDKGIYRMGFSKADFEGRFWLMEQIRQAGYQAEMDGAGNVFGKVKEPYSGPAVLTGSHLDTVPCGGALDGALGVLAALECLRVIREEGIQTKYPVELVAFSDEEGRFGGMIGSQALAGDLTPESIEKSMDTEGVILADVLRERGLDAMTVLGAWRDPATIQAYLELHIEQGRVLESLNKEIGIVEGIVGLFKWQIRLIGAANHEGTTPMNLRNDAFLALADFAHEIPRILDENGTEISRATIGKVELQPGFAHTIPGQVEFTLVVRDNSREILDELAIAFRKTLSAIARRSSLMFEFEELNYSEPSLNDPGMSQLIEKVAKKMNFEHYSMFSGAGHDAQVMSRITRTGMIFVPSKEGISHSPAEWTDAHHLEIGANLLLNTLLEVAGIQS